LKCDHYIDGKCCFELAVAVYGETPSSGICMSLCPHLTINGEKAARPKEKEFQASQSKTVVKKSLVEKGASWTKAEVSKLLKGSVSEEELEARLSACRGCSELDRSSNPDEIGWCKACGCGKWKRAELTVKGQMPAATCPLGKWPNLTPKG
jgi:hypothetical protein